ncbi:MAG TPA: thioredoxin domain-containing protein, partial [Polyangiaceae bacterium]
MQRAVRFLTLALLVVLVACGGASTPPSGPAVGLPLVQPSASPLPVAPKYVAGSSETDAAVPIELDDPVWGARDALVTIVEFSDFQCPYCSKAYGTVEQVLKEYGPNTVRLVFKNEPLPFHPMARPTAEAAVTVRGLGGNEAFWTFYRSAFEEQKDLSAAAIDRWVSRSGVALNVFHDALASHRFTDKVDRDHAMAQKVGVNGTPAFYINGVTLVGAQPYEKFKETIETELGKAKEALGKGITADRLYRTLAAQNFKMPADDDDDEHEDTTTVWRVPVGTSPTLGPVTALVTIV